MLWILVIFTYILRFYLLWYKYERRRHLNDKFTWEVLCIKIPVFAEFLHKLQLVKAWVAKIWSYFFQILQMQNADQDSLKKVGAITVWPEPIWIKVTSWWQILPQHQSTYLRGPESASIEIPSFRPHFIKFSKTVSYEVNLTARDAAPSKNMGGIICPWFALLDQ